MTEPNAPLVVSRRFNIRSSNKVWKAVGIIKHAWFPEPRLYFDCRIIKKGQLSSSELIWSKDKIEIIIDNNLPLECFFSFVYGKKSKYTVSGMISKNVLIGDKTMPVDQIHFDFPNLGGFVNALVKKKEVIKYQIELCDAFYDISLSSVSRFNEYFEKLNKIGGYITLYSGVCTKKKGSFDFVEIERLQKRLSLFFSFIVGQYVAPFIIFGKYKGEKVWEYYPDNQINSYKPVRGSVIIERDGFTKLWTSFCSYIADETNLEVFSSALHWYIEANKNSGNVEGAIVLIQNALELLYNWLIVEGQKTLSEDDSDRISAASKIRLILSTINVSFDIPDELNGLKKFAKGNNLADAASVFTNIRNSIVHPSKKKRSKLKLLDVNTLLEAKKLAIWYTELLLLKMVDHKGSYFNRCTSKIEKVPWA